ncbi:MAG: dockerin type I repeat-containing protein [Verrucomicrobiota bacterium]
MTSPAGCPFFLGDVNGDGLVDILDQVTQINVILGFSNAPSDICAADLDGNGILNVTDVVAIVNVILGSK